MAEISHGSYPNSEILNSMQNGKILFFGLYFTMTGFHGLHIVVGIFVMLWVLHLISIKKITHENRIFLENTTLYWDMVHLVWVFLFPLFYMIQFGV
jgi:cytochrome c oxidase subunit 3